MPKNYESQYRENKITKNQSLRNRLLGIVLFLGIVNGSIFILNILLTQVNYIVIKMLKTVRRLDAVIIVALITGAVSIIGVVFSSIVAKYIDYQRNRQEYLAQKREVPYTEFVEMIYKVLDLTKKETGYDECEMTDDIEKFSKQLTLWGSHRVVSKWVEFRRIGSDPEAAKNNLLIMEEIMNEMRHDLGLKRVKQGQLLTFFINDIQEQLKNTK